MPSVTPTVFIVSGLYKKNVNFLCKICKKKTKFMIIFDKKRDIRHSYIPLSAVGQNRTVDTRIFSPLLYRLSYNGVTKAILSVFPNYVNRKL